jgi:hypothetical protein
VQCAVWGELVSFTLPYLPRGRGGYLGWLEDG